MRKRNNKPPFIQTQRVFKLPHQIGIVSEQLACKFYTTRKLIAAQLNMMAVPGFIPLSPGSPIQGLNQMSYLTTHISIIRVGKRLVRSVSRKPD